MKKTVKKVVTKTVKATKKTTKETPKKVVAEKPKDPTCLNCEGTGLAPIGAHKNDRHICPECVGSGKV